MDVFIVVIIEIGFSGFPLNGQMSDCRHCRLVLVETLTWLSSEFMVVYQRMMAVVTDKCECTV